jgi:FixJ family two-component response regulator
MPEISGDELAASIKEIEPNEPVIMLTGFADLINDTDRRSENVDLIVSKPARLDDLRRAIREVMPKLKRRRTQASATEALRSESKST